MYVARRIIYFTRYLENKIKFHWYSSDKLKQVVVLLSSEIFLKYYDKLADTLLEFFFRKLRIFPLTNFSFLNRKLRSNQFLYLFQNNIFMNCYLNEKLKRNWIRLESKS